MVRFLLTLVLVISILSGIMLILYSYKRKSIPGAKYFTIIVLSMMTYDATYIGELNSSEISTALIWFNLEHIPILTEPYFWVLMCLDYTRMSQKYLKIFKRIMIPCLVFFYITFFTNDFHHMYISKYEFVSNGHFNVLVYEKEVIFFILITYITICGLISTVLYVRGYIKSTKLHKYGYIIMIIASLFPWGAVYLNLTPINFLLVDLFPLVTIFSGVLYLLGIFQYNIFKTLPIATETVYRLASDGIAIIDVTDRIIDTNKAFFNSFPEIKKFPKEYTLPALIKDNSNLKELTDKKKIEYSINVNGTSKYYSAELTEIITDNIPIGKILYIKDITLFLEHEKQLEIIALNAMNQAELNELSFLQAQIKPHFFNNTLSIIASMITREPEKAKELVINLSEFLIDCYKIDNSSHMILLNDELEIINTYVKIEKARFMNRLNFQIINYNVSNVYIPKFSLQPLVENAIKHGILKKVEGGNVVVEISNDDEQLFFQIKDDGVGITDAKVQALLNGHEENQGVGIINVHRRLLKYYGTGLNIQSIIGHGTIVSFSIPLEKINKALERSEFFDKDNCCR